MDSADYKQTISRSYSEKVNCGNYETKDFFSSRNLELDAERYTPEELDEFSEDLFRKCYLDVQKNIIELKKGKGEIKEFDWKKVKKCVMEMFEGRPSNMGDFQDFNREEQDFINECKKLFKRSPVYKATIERR